MARENKILFVNLKNTPLKTSSSKIGANTSKGNKESEFKISKSDTSIKGKFKDRCLIMLMIIPNKKTIKALNKSKHNGFFNNTSIII